MPWFEQHIKSGKRRIMGIGHRVYKANDPRAAILRRHAEALAESSGKRKWFDIAVKLADTARADDYFVQRNLYPNVDYYSAIVLYTLDLDIDMFTPLFAMSRIAGWSAHVIDQMGGRLIRPKANYVGTARFEVGPHLRALAQAALLHNRAQRQLRAYLAGRRICQASCKYATLISWLAAG